MRLGYFGGSFDPPHLGHLAVARAAAASFALDEILFVPTGNQPLKPDGATASFGDRLAMVELLCGGQARFRASALEAPRPGGQPNYTVDTLAQLRSEIAPGDSIFVLVGADSFLDLRRWREPERLLSLAKWIVVSRPGFSLRQLDALDLTPRQLERVHLLEGIAETSSATQVRRRLSTGSPCTGLLSTEVLAYIRSNQLYGT